MEGTTNCSRLLPESSVRQPGTQTSSSSSTTVAPPLRKGGGKAASSCMRVSIHVFGMTDCALAGFGPPSSQRSTYSQPSPSIERLPRRRSSVIVQGGRHLHGSLLPDENKED